jgi:hypothetical protein
MAWKTTDIVFALAMGGMVALCDTVMLGLGSRFNKNTDLTLSAQLILVVASDQSILEPCQAVDWNLEPP